MNFGEVFQPQDGQAVRFCTATSISGDVRKHGINGFFRNGRFWSVDMADRWMPHEITNWCSLGETARPNDLNLNPAAPQEGGGVKTPDGEQR
jgi:hypothetical protein